LEVIGIPNPDAYPRTPHPDRIRLGGSMNSPGAFVTILGLTVWDMQIYSICLLSCTQRVVYHAGCVCVSPEK